MATNPFDDTNKTILGEIRQYHDQALKSKVVPSGFERVPKVTARERWMGLSVEERQAEIDARGVAAVMGDL